MDESNTKIELNVKLTPEETIGRISSVMDKEKIFSIFKYTGDNQLIGKIKGSSFLIRIKKDYANSWSPILSGKVKPTQAGCRVKAKFRVCHFTRVFTIVWHSMIAFLILIGLFILFTSLINKNFELRVLVVILVPLLMLGFGIHLAYVYGKVGKTEAEEVRQVFLNLFDDVSI